MVYKVDSTGHETVLHSFTGGADGGQPGSGVIHDSAGNLYGTCYQGGADGAGVVYKIAPDGTETVLHNFTGGADGGQPYSVVIGGANGRLYGTTTSGGVSGHGVLFELSSGSETVVYNFTGAVDGSSPGPLIRDASGNFYGTAGGGPKGGGVVFKVDTTAHETVVYGFTAPHDGSVPSSGVIRDSAGSFYGTTSAGVCTIREPSSSWMQAVMRQSSTASSPRLEQAERQPEI